MATLVSVKLTVGIPSKIVHYTLLGYGGTFNGGVKCNPNPTIDLDQTGPASFTFPVPSWGTTHRYNEADSVLVSGKPDWYRDLKAGAAPVESKQFERTPENLDAKFTQMAGATHAVAFTVVGANPLLPGAPAIDAEITVGLRKAGAGIEYTVKGDHDGFPNYTLEINGKQVYFWDCVAGGETPGALKPPMDKSITIDWKLL